jgi:multidrug efflux pump subunit AcrA (membrane-fusion protein)
VVNPKRLWVEGYAYDMSGLGDVLDADAMAATGHNYHLKFISRGPQLEKQTIPLFFEIENPDAALSVGSLLTLLVQTGDSRDGLIVPRSAVVQDPSGQWIVWRHDYAEGFIATPVRTEPIDGENVLVVAGLQPDARVVVDGADLLTEIR